MLGVKSGEQGDKSVSLMRDVPKPSHAVCFRSWANSHNTRVCVSEQSGVQTGARRVSQNTRVCGVLTKAKKGAGSRQPLAALVGASRIAHRLLPTRAYPSDTLNLPTARHTTKVLLPHAGGGELYVLRKVWPTEIFPPPILYLRRVQTVESRMGKHPDRRPRGSVCAPVTTPACAVPAEILGGGCELCEFNTS